MFCVQSYREGKQGGEDVSGGASLRMGGHGVAGGGGGFQAGQRTVTSSHRQYRQCEEDKIGKVPPVKVLMALHM